MAKTDFKSHDEYLATLTPAQGKTLTAVRKAIAAAAPDAVETISYQAPAFKIGKAWVAGYAAHKDHWSLICPPPSRAFVRFAAELAAYEVTKSAVRVPFDRPVPVKLVKDLAAFRAQEARTSAASQEAGGPP